MRCRMHLTVFLVQRTVPKHGEWNHDCSLANKLRDNEQSQPVRAELFDAAADLPEKLFLSVMRPRTAV